MSGAIYKKLSHSLLVPGPLFRAEHFRFGPVLDQNKQPNRFFFFVYEPNRTKNRFKPINFGSVRFGLFPFQTGSNRTAMPRCHPVRINNVVLVVTTSCKGKIIAKKQYQFLAIIALIFLDTLQLLDPK
jgi:hypothetical protein